MAESVVVIEIVVASVEVAAAVVVLAESGVMIEIVGGKGNEFAQPKKVGSVIVWRTYKPSIKCCLE